MQTKENQQEKKKREWKKWFISHRRLCVSLHILIYLRRLALAPPNYLHRLASARAPSQWYIWMELSNGVSALSRRRFSRNTRWEKMRREVKSSRHSFPHTNTYTKVRRSFFDANHLLLRKALHSTFLLLLFGHACVSFFWCRFWLMIQTHRTKHKKFSSQLLSFCLHKLHTNFNSFSFSHYNLAESRAKIRMEKEKNECANIQMKYLLSTLCWHFVSRQRFFCRQNF